MHITSFNVSTKKGESQSTRWLIVQETPHPDIRSNGSLQWRNGGGLFPSYGQDAKGIGRKYRCHLLVPEGDIPEDYNRVHFAGYTHGSYGKPQITNPGAVTFRGRSLGEMSVDITYYMTGNGFTDSDNKVNGYSRPNPSEMAMIRQLIVPKLQEYIEDNKKSLYGEAVATIEKRLNDELNEAHKELHKLHAEAGEALAFIAKQAP